jgi:hypothetical protein
VAILPGRLGLGSVSSVATANVLLCAALFGGKVSIVTSSFGARFLHPLLRFEDLPSIWGAIFGYPFIFGSPSTPGICVSSLGETKSSITAGIGSSSESPITLPRRWVKVSCSGCHDPNH